MKKYFLTLISLIFVGQLDAQTIITERVPYANDSRVITTAVPFLLIASDARAAGHFHGDRTAPHSRSAG